MLTFWNADKQRANHKREYIGKFDGETFAPNKNFYRLQAEYQQSVETAKTGSVPTDVCLRHGKLYELMDVAVLT